MTISKKEAQAYTNLRYAAVGMQSHAAYVVELWDALGDPSHNFWQHLNDDELLHEFDLVIADMAQDQEFFDDALMRLTEALDDLGAVYARS